MCRILLVSVVSLLLAPPAVAAAPKNVVLMVVDDQGLDAGCYGHAALRTPHLDALAATGTRFTHAFCTTSSCSASRSVLLTGLHNHANGQYGLQHATHNFSSLGFVRGLPVLLREAGYRTCQIGKFHVQPAELYRCEVDLRGGSAGPRNPVRMAEDVREFLSADDERPFFLYFCPTDPHRAARGFANEQEYDDVEPVVYRPEDVIVPPFLPDTPETRADLAEYYQSVSRVDQGLGALLRVLAETGHSEDTLFIYLSDNGSPFPGAKTTLYEPGMRLPLVVRVPGQATPGGTCDALVTWADITPTILDFTAAAGPKYPLHGRSFLGVIDQEHPQGWDEVHASHTFHEVTMYYPMRVVRTRRHKLIMNLAHELPYPFASDLYESPTWQGVLARDDSHLGNRPVEAFIHRPRYELYDLEVDPHELTNLADSTEHAALLAELQANLRAWQEKTADPWVIKYEHE
jgi:N-sulfoglucosamine sulfohydrolase